MAEWVAVEPVSDAPEQRAYWEPWTPKVGDRVRVRVNGECGWDSWALSTVDGSIVSAVGHRLAEVNRRGTVVECPFIELHGFCAEVRAGYDHVLVVRFDEPLIDGEIRGSHGHYAACELEPLP